MLNVFRRAVHVAALLCPFVFMSSSVFAQNASNPQSLTSIGAPLPGVRVEVVDPTGALVDRGEEGEISIASPFSSSPKSPLPSRTTARVRCSGARSGIATTLPKLP